MTPTSSRSTRPLSAGTFLRRNIRRTLPVALVIMVAVMLIVGIISLMNSIPLSVKTIYRYLENETGISTRINPLLGPQLRRDIIASTPFPLDRVIDARVVPAKISSIVGDWPFVVLALTDADRDYYMRAMRSGKLMGRLPSGSAAEAVISDPVARSLKKKVGDLLLSPEWDDRFSPNPVRIVGIVQSPEYYAIIPQEYHKQFHGPPVDIFLCFTKDRSKQKEFDTWALDKFTSATTQVFSYSQVVRQSDQMFEILYRILNIVILVLVIVITFMMALLINIHQTQRIHEYALLQALGYTKRQLVTRAMSEMVILIVGGWIAGCALAYGMLVVVNNTLMYPRAFALNLLDAGAFAGTVPVPLAILATSAYTILRNFRRFDPVGTLERRIA